MISSIIAIIIIILIILLVVIFIDKSNIRLAMGKLGFLSHAKSCSIEI